MSVGDPEFSGACSGRFGAALARFLAFEAHGDACFAPADGYAVFWPDKVAIFALVVHILPHVAHKFPIRICVQSMHLIAFVAPGDHGLFDRIFCVLGVDFLFFAALGRRLFQSLFQSHLGK